MKILVKSKIYTDCTQLWYYLYFYFYLHNTAQS